MTDEPKPPDLAAALAEPFDPSEVEWKPQAVSGNRALAIAYVDARAVMDRLDRALGVGNWQTTYRELPDGVVCCLRVRVGEEWCAHEDVGGYSDQQDRGDRLKAAYSDALKRAAVHLGIGRYLYRLPAQWVDYDPQKRQFVKTPTLPAWATPKAKRTAAEPGKAKAAPANGAAQALPDKTTLPKKEKPSPARKLRDDTNTNDEALAKKGVIQAGELANELLEFGREEGFHLDVLQWDEAEVEKARKHLAGWVDQKKADKRARELAQVKGG